MAVIDIEEVTAHKKSQAIALGIDPDIAGISFVDSDGKDIGHLVVVLAITVDIDSILRANGQDASFPDIKGRIFAKTHIELLIMISLYILCRNNISTDLDFIRKISRVNRYIFMGILG